MLRSALLALLFDVELIRGVHHQKLSQTEEPVTTFDHTVLGNLANADQLAGLQILHKHLFVAGITVGTPPQTLTCLLDSGTADLWLPSKRCTSCDGERHFHADKSDTFMPAVVHTPDGLMPVPVQVSYGSGDIVGFLVQDHIVLAGHQFTNQSFIIVEEEDLPKHRSWDGVCGLGWKTLTDAGLPLYKNEHEHEEPIFALVPRAGPGPMATILTVGGVPEEAIQMSSLGWATAEPLQSGHKRSYWVASGGVSINSGAPIKGRVLVDTATAYLLAPPRHYQNVLRSLFPQKVFDQSCGVDASSGNLVVCDCAATLDDTRLAKSRITLHLGGKEFPIDSPQLFKRVPATNGEKLCLLLIQQAPVATVMVDPLEVLAGLLAAGRAAGAGQGGKDGGALSPAAILAPFLFPGLVPVPAGVKVGKRPAGGEEIEQVEQMMPDGSLCTATLVWVGGHLKSNTTKCDGPTKVQQRRRLGATAPAPSPAAPAGPADPMEDVWVLGGVFLEHFAAVFDFRGARLGLAMPNPDAQVGTGEFARIAASSIPAETINGAHRTIYTAATTPVGEQPHQGSSASFPWVGAVLVVVMVGGGAFAYNFYQKVKRRKNLNASAGAANDGHESEEVADDPEQLLAE